MPALPLTFPGRPRLEVRHDHRRRVWTSRCGRFRVVHSRCLLAGGRETWYAQRATAPAYDPARVCWENLSTHKGKATALAACQRAAAAHRAP